jgi:hypothetical protein
MHGRGERSAGDGSECYRGARRRRSEVSAVEQELEGNRKKNDVKSEGPMGIEVSRE